MCNNYDCKYQGLIYNMAEDNSPDDFKFTITDMSQYISMSKRFQSAEQTKEEYKEVDNEYIESLISHDIVSIDKIIEFYKLDMLPVSEETIQHIATQIYEQVNENMRYRFSK